MDKLSFTIWGREFELDVVFDCYPGEQVTMAQRQALGNFIGRPDLLDDVKTEVEKYCKQMDPSVTTDNIFKFVIPRSLFVKRDKNDCRILSLMCAFKLDIEHGLAVVFRNEIFEQIGPQDIIL